MNIEELKEKLLSVGFTEEVLSGIQEDKLQGLVENLKPKEISFDDFLKDPKNQGEFDRRMTKGQSKAIEKALAKIKVEEDPKPEIKNNGGEPEWLEKLLKQNQLMAEKLENLEKGAVTKSKKDQAKDLMSKSKLPDNLKEKWFNRIDINSETPFNQQVEELEKEYTGLVQSVADEKTTGGAPPKKGFDKKPTDKELDKYITI